MKITLADAIGRANMAWLDYASEKATFSINGKTVDFSNTDVVKLFKYLIHNRGWVGGGSSYGRKLLWLPK